MQQVKFNKQMQQQYNYYKHKLETDPIKSLYKAYQKPSYYKVRAFENCMRILTQYNGFNFTILGANCQTFSVGFECIIDNKLHFVWITPYNHRICCVKE